MRPCIILTLATLSLLSCAEDTEQTSNPVLYGDFTNGDVGSDEGTDVDTDGTDDTPNQGEWRAVFQENFEISIDPPFVPDHPDLPTSLFPEDASRWTQLQNSHIGLNLARLERSDLEETTYLWMYASGQPGETASKMDLGRDVGLEAHIGDTVRLSADFFVVDSTGAQNFPDNTLIDLEDVDDLMLNAQQPGAGLRIRTNAQGFLALDRGELLGSDAGEPAHFRLGTLSSTYTFPLNTWVRIETTIRLGVAVARSVETPIDLSFHKETTPAWCEIHIQEASSDQKTLVMRQKGTTFLDREVGRKLFAEQAPNDTVVWPEDLDYNSVQFGLTNNRSRSAKTLLMDNVLVEVLRGN